MKLKEFLESLTSYLECQGPYDPEQEVVIKLENPSVGPVAVSKVYNGFDWNKGRLLIYPSENLVLATNVTQEDISKAALQTAEYTHEKLGFEYPRKRKDAWLKGFMAGAAWGKTKLKDKNKL